MNGSLVGTASGQNTMMTKTASSTFWLGSDNRSGATRLKGRMNDFRLYNHALSIKEVEEISKGLVLHYKLDNDYGTGNIIYDSSGYRNNGVLNDTSALYREDSARYDYSIYHN